MKRPVVVLSDGAATVGRCLDEIVSMTTDDEDPVTSFCAIGDGGFASVGGCMVTVEQITGSSLEVAHRNDVQIFFLGFGDAEGHVGRILAEATDAEYQGSTDEDLAAVIEELSGYF